MLNINNQAELIKQLNEIKSQLADPSIPVDLKEDMIIQIRQLTCKETNPNIQEIIDCEIVGPIIALEYQVTDLGRLNILWILSNICSGTSQQTDYIINVSGIDIFGRYCYHQNKELAMQALWGLGNIAGDSPIRRDLVLGLGCLREICTLVDRTDLQLSDLRTVTWVLSNLVRGKPRPQFHKIKDTIPYFVKLLSSFDNEIIMDTLWGLSYLSDNDESHNQLLQLNFLTELSKFINIQTSHQKLIPAIRIIGNIASGEEEGVNQIIQNNLIDALIQVQSQSYKQTIQKEIFWTLSNIAAGTEQQQLYLLQNPMFKQLIEQVFAKELQPEIKQEFYWIISNLTTNTQPTYIFIQYQWVDLWFENLSKIQFAKQKQCNTLVDLFAEGMTNISKCDKTIFQKYQETLLNLEQQLGKIGLNLVKLYKLFDSLNFYHEQPHPNRNNKLENKFGEMKIEDEGASDSDQSADSKSNSSDSGKDHALNDCEAAMVNEIEELAIDNKSSESED